MDQNAPIVTRMNEVGEAVVERTSAPQVQTQMTETNDDYSILCKRLAEAKFTLLDIVQRTDKLKSKAGEIEKKTPKLREKIEIMEPVASRPHAVKKQMIQTEEIQKEVKEIAAALECAQEEQEWLFENTELEPKMKKEIEEVVHRLEIPFNEVQAELNKRQGELQAVLVVSQEFETISEEFITWLSTVEEEQMKEKTVSAVYNTVKKQEQEHKVGLVLF